MPDPGTSQALNAPHVREINEFVDRLQEQGRGDVPHVAAIHGGVDAPILSVLARPGSGALSGAGGSGLLSIENNDPTSRNQRHLLQAVGLDPTDLTPWNAYPWATDKTTLDAADLDAGAAALVEVIRMMRHLKVLFLQGRGEPIRVWKRAQARYPELRDGTRGFKVEFTVSPAPQGTVRRTREATEKARREQAESYGRVADIAHKTAW